MASTLLSLLSLKRVKSTRLGLLTSDDVTVEHEDKAADQRSPRGQTPNCDGIPCQSLFPIAQVMLGRQGQVKRESALAALVVSVIISWSDVTASWPGTSPRN